MTTELNVLVADTLASDQLSPLHEAGIGVRDRAGIDAQELASVLGDDDGLLVRSRTRVTAALLAAAPRLKVVGRAGTGVDNIDVEAATRAGVVVMNTPGANTIAAAEQALALMFSLARSIPAAAASLREGHWNRKDFQGTELTGRTLGVVGLGRIGREVALRAQGLRMKVLGFDPVMTAEAAEDLGIEMRTLEELAAEVDYLSLHVPLTAGTRHLVGRALLAKARPGIRIINAARGGIVDEDALLEALRDGRVGGAGLDVFEQEPPTTFDLMRHPLVVATPHLGASTAEAQAGVASGIARQVAGYLRHGTIENAVNLTGLPAYQDSGLEPWARLARRLGGVAAGLLGEGPRSVEVSLFGEISHHPAEIFTREVLLGLLKPFGGDRVNLVNAPLFAEERGVTVSVGRRGGHRSFQSLIRIRVKHEEETVSLSGTLFGTENLRIVRAFGFNMDAIPEGPMILCAHDDRPGVVAHLSASLAEAGINIANMSVGRDQSGGRALAVLNVDEEPSAETLRRLSELPAIHWTRHVPRVATEV